MTVHDDKSTPAAIAVLFDEPGIAVVKLRGEHDLSGKQRLADSLAMAGGKRDVLVDLSECTFMDSSVIGVLSLACDRVIGRGGWLRLVIPPEATTVRRTSTLTGLAGMLPTFESTSAALAGVPS